MPTPSRTRASLTAGPPVRRRRKVVWIVGAAAVVVLAAAVLTVRFLLADERKHHELPPRWPVESPHGEPFRVGHAVKAGDIFVTTLAFESGVVLGFDPPDPFQGMRLDGSLRIGHGVKERPGGLASTVRVVLYLVRASYGPMQDAIALPLRADSGPYTITFDRAPDGRPLPGSAARTDASGEQRRAIDTVTAGLGDFLTNWVPDRPIRLGETWDVAEVADVLPHVVEMLHRASAVGEGFPKPAVRGRVGAEALEERDGEPCVRLWVACGASAEGMARSGSVEAWLTCAARVEGPIWVSTQKGLVWGMDLRADLKSSFMLPKAPQLRNASQRITAKTARAAAMPE